MRIRTKAIYSFISLLAIFGTSASAASSGGGGSGFGFHAGTHVGIGRMGNESLSKRTMDSLNLEVMPGYHHGSLLGGLLFDYSFNGQLTSKDDTNGSSFGGKEFLVGLGLSYSFAPWKALISYDFIGSYSVSSGNIVGGDTKFKGPSGFHLLGGYMFAPNWYFDGEIRSVHYSTEEVAGIETDIGNDSLSHWSIAAGISYSY